MTVKAEGGKEPRAEEGGVLLQAKEHEQLLGDGKGKEQTLPLSFQEDSVLLTL